MENQIICSHCHEQYRDDNLPRILIECGHTFCQHCLASFVINEEQNNQCCFAQCPEDQIKTQLMCNNVAKLPKNLALIKVIENKKLGTSFKDHEINVSKITKNSSIHEQQESNQLISMIDQEHQQSLRIQNEQKQKSLKAKTQVKQQAQQICKIHRKPLDIVCTVDLKKICANCAIFGQHRGHQFKSLQEISQMQKQYCSQIKAIIQEKEKLSKQIDCSETKHDILSILATKKNKLKNKIVQQYNKLESKIATKKKEILKSLDEVTKKQEGNIKNCMKFNEKIVNNYKEWLKKSKSQLKILQQDDFQAKLILLFEGKNIDGDIIELGNNLIDQMKVQEQNILEQVQKKLQNLTININQQIYNHIDNLIQIGGQNFKQISNITVKTDVVASTQRTTLTPININTSFNNIVLPTNLNKPIQPLTSRGQNRIDFVQKKVQSKVPCRQYQSTKNLFINIQKSAKNNNGSPTNLDQSLLQNDQMQNQPSAFQFQARTSMMVPPSIPIIPLSQRFSYKSNRQSPKNFTQKQPISKLKTPTQEPVEIKAEKINKKKLRTLKLPEKYEKIVESLLTNSLQILDLTNGQFGDSITSTICENLVGTKVRTLKLIRNKLTDEGVAKMIPFMGQVTTLNLSQNLLTENILDILFQNQKYLGSLHTVILSQNKIVERKSKAKIDKIKKIQWNISL